MELRRKLRQIAVHRDEVIVHVARMTGGIAQPRNAGDFGDAAQQLTERPRAAVPILAVVRVDVLADQRHLAHTSVGEVSHFFDDLLDRPRDFRAARVGHDAERTELVAAFLHGDEGGHAARARRRLARRGKEIELVLDRKLGLDRAVLAREQIGQPVIALRADDQIDYRRAADDLRALRLRDAARHRHGHAPPVVGGVFLELAHPAELRIDLLGRLFPDMAGVQDDQIRIVRRCCLHIAFGREQVRHTMGIVDVHLAAVGFDVELARHAVGALPR